jgi:hypothetical protein
MIIVCILYVQTLLPRPQAKAMDGHLDLQFPVQAILYQALLLPLHLNGLAPPQVTYVPPL